MQDGASSALRFLDREIDPATESVRCGAEEWRLRQKSFQVLMYLIGHRGRIVTREELFEAIWPEVAVTEDALVQCIVDIRKALGDDSRAPRFVRTVPKRGYSFIAPASDAELDRIASSITFEVETTKSVEYEIVEDIPAHPREAPSRRIAVAAAIGLTIAVGGLLMNRGRTPVVSFAAAQTPPPSLVSSLTPSAEAYRLYSVAVDRTRELRTAEAIALLQQAVRLDPGFAMAHARIGYALGIANGEADAARPHLRKAASLGDRLSEKDRMVVGAWTAIVDGNFEDAIERLRLVIDRYPTETENHLRLAVLLQGEERVDEAITVLERAVLIDPNDPHLRNTLGGLYSVEGRHDEAIRERRLYASLRPEEPNAWDSLGLSSSWGGRYDEALDAYARALEVGPDFMLARYHRVATLVQLGRFREALADVERCLAAGSDDRERGRALAAIAEIHRLAGDAELAAKTARRVSPDSGWLVSAHAGEPETYSDETLARLQQMFNGRGARGPRRMDFQLRAHAALRRGDAEAAVQLFRESLRFAPLIWAVDSLETGLAEAYEELGRHREARDEYSRVLALNPHYARALIGRARASEALGLKAEARSDYASFLDLWEGADADARDLAEANAALARLR